MDINQQITEIIQAKLGTDTEVTPLGESEGVGVDLGAAAGTIPDPKELHVGGKVWAKGHNCYYVDSPEFRAMVRRLRQNPEGPEIRLHDVNKDYL